MNKVFLALAVTGLAGACQITGHLVVTPCPGEGLEVRWAEACVVDVTGRCEEYADDAGDCESGGACEGQSD